MSRLVEVLEMCSKNDSSYEWITHYVSTSDGVYEKVYLTFGDLLNDLTNKRGHYRDEELGVLNIQIDGPENTFACQTIEVLNYFRSCHGFYGVVDPFITPVELWKAVFRTATRWV